MLRCWVTLQAYHRKVAKERKEADEQARERRKVQLAAKKTQAQERHKLREEYAKKRKAAEEEDKKRKKLRQSREIPSDQPAAQVDHTRQTQAAGVIAAEVPLWTSGPEGHTVDEAGMYVCDSIFHDGRVCGYKNATFGGLKSHQSRAHCSKYP